MSPETAVREHSSRPQVAAEGLFEARKEAFLKARNCEQDYRISVQDFQEIRSGGNAASGSNQSLFLLTSW